MLLKRENFASDYDFVLYLLIEHCFSFNCVSPDYSTDKLKKIMDAKGLDPKQVIRFLQVWREEINAAYDEDY